MKHLTCLMSVVLLAGCDLDLTSLTGCEYERDFTEQMSASGLAALIADVEDGGLRIEGRGGSNQIRVYAHACASDPGTLRDIDFEFSRLNGRAQITSYVPNYDRARLDFVIEVPMDFDAEVYDTDGDMTVRDIHSAWIDDGSGNIEARNLSGDLTVYRDRGGSIYYSNINGLVLLP